MTEDSTIRLSKRMTELGLCSRREADEFIQMGRVRVDGEVVDTLGSRVTPDQVITLAALDMAPQPDRVSLLLRRNPGTDPFALIIPERRSQTDMSDIFFLKKHLTHLETFGAVEPMSQGLWLATQDRTFARAVREAEHEWLLWVQEDIDGARARLEATGLKVSKQSDRQLRILVDSEQSRRLGSLCRSCEVSLAAMQCQRIGSLAGRDLESGQWRYLSGFDKV